MSLLAVAGWTFLRHRPSRVAIEGPSMAPTLFPGDWVVVVEHPGRPAYEIIKRLVGIPEIGRAHV